MLTEQAALFEISAAITSGLELKTVLHSILDQCRAVLPLDTLYIALYDRRDASYQIPFFWDLGVYRSLNEHIDIHDRPSLTRLVIESGRTLYVPDLLDPDTASEYPNIKVADAPTRSYIGTPLLMRGDVIGVLSIQQVQPAAYSTEQIRLLEMIASLAAVAVENARLYEAVQADLAAHKRMQAALAASEERLRLATAVGAVGIWDWESDSNELIWDAQMRSIHGVSDDAPVSFEIWREMIVPDDRALAAGTAQAAITGGMPRTVEYRVVDPNGQLRYISSRGTAVKDDAGMVVRQIGVSVDITARIQMEDALRLSNAELDRAARMKDEFLANMSHELRTPLSAILAISESLSDQVYGPLTERELRAVNNVDVSARHQLALINDLLDLSKIEAGKLELEREWVEVDGICKQSLAFVKDVAGRKQIALKYINNQPDAKCLADSRRLKQILINLLSNAVKFTPAHGRVVLGVEVNDQDGVITFAVSDTGPGIPPDQQSRLFQPFTQLHAGQAPKHEGTGLGLALVKRLAVQHGGAVNVESTGIPGAGACFIVTLPIGAPKPQNMTGAALDDRRSGSTPPADAARNAAILLVEDDELSQTVTDEYLSTRGYRVRVAESGPQALELAAAEPPDLILMDIQLPGMDGLEVMRRLRAQPAFARTPIIAVTALAMAGDQQRCLQAGASHYMSKPFRLKELEALVQQFLYR